MKLATKADQILSEAAQTYRERNAVYGNNFERAGKALNALFPNGINLKTVDDQTRFQIFNLIIVKLSRYAVNWYDGHKDSIHDALVYCAMLEAIDANATIFDADKITIPSIDQEARGG